MPTKQPGEPAGLGRKRPLRNIEIARLHLDPANPRLPEEAQGGTQPALLEHLFQHFDLEEIAAPMAQNGSFDSLGARIAGLPPRVPLGTPGEPCGLS